MTNGAKRCFAENFAILLDKSNMSKEEFARRAGVSYNQVHVWLRGKTFPQLKNLGGIARALGTDVNTLLRGVENKETEE